MTASDLAILIRNTVKTLVKVMLKVPVRTGTVSNVDTNKNTCQVTLSTGADIFDVQFQSITQNGQTGLLCVPADKSTVLIAMVENLDMQWVIIATSNVDSFSIFTTGGKLEVLKNGIVQLNGNKVGGIDSPMPEANGLLKRINNLETFMSAHQHAYVSPGGPAVTTDGGSQQITPQTAIADISNNKVKQGDGN